MMADEAEGFLMKTFEQQVTDLLKQEAIRKEIMQQPAYKRVNAFSELLQSTLLSFILIKSLNLDYEKTIRDKLSWLQNYRFEAPISA